MGLGPGDEGLFSPGWSHQPRVKVYLLEPPTESKSISLAPVDSSNQNQKSKPSAPLPTGAKGQPRLNNSSRVSLKG